jgi:membrane protein YdbS with pleckstrin-like domain
MASDSPRDREGRDDWDTEPIPELPHQSPPPDEPRWNDNLVEDPPPPPPIDEPLPPPPLPDPAEADLDGFRYDSAGLPVGPRRVLPLEPDPSPLISMYLFPTERFRGEWRRHWMHLLPYVAAGVFATFVMGYLSGVLARNQADLPMTVVVAAWLGVLGWVGWQVVDWWFDRFLLTNKRVMVVAGVITRNVAMMPLSRVTDMKFEQSPMGRMLDYGTFVLESAGQDQALREVKHLPHPTELYNRICEEMYEPAAVEARISAAKKEEEEEVGEDA